MAANIIKSTKAPNLPIPTVAYSQTYTESFSNALRLYFNTIDAFTTLLGNTAGGAALRFPNGAFHQDGFTTLTANMTNNSTTPIQVTSTAGFLSAGALIIESELIRYTGKTATTFTGITRGAYGSTNVAHTAGVYVSEAQPVPSPTTALTVVFTTTDASNQVSIDTLDPTKVVHDVAGYYNLQFSLQMLTFSNTIDNVTVWFKQNGNDVANSAGIATVPSRHAGGAGTAIISWNLVLPFNAGDYIQLMVASTTGNTVCATYPPGTSPVHPASPSIILTSTFVSALY